jgi:hypothetical protein
MQKMNAAESTRTFLIRENQQPSSPIDLFVNRLIGQESKFIVKCSGYRVASKWLKLPTFRRYLLQPFSESK